MIPVILLLSGTVLAYVPIAAKGSLSYSKWQVFTYFVILWPIAALFIMASLEYWFL